jgi:hypothetical protein
LKLDFISYSENICGCSFSIRKDQLIKSYFQNSIYVIGKSLKIASIWADKNRLKVTKENPAYYSLEKNEKQGIYA